MTGVDRIRAERQRQLEIEGYGIKHDRLRSEWSLIVAAIDAELAKAGALIAAAIDAELGRLAKDDDSWAQGLSCPSCGAQPGHPHDATCEEIR